MIKNETTLWESGSKYSSLVALEFGSIKLEYPMGWHQERPLAGLTRADLRRLRDVLIATDLEDIAERGWGE